MCRWAADGWRGLARTRPRMVAWTRLGLQKGFAGHIMQRVAPCRSRGRGASSTPPSCRRLRMPTAPTVLPVNKPAFCTTLAGHVGGPPRQLLQATVVEGAKGAAGAGCRRAHWAQVSGHTADGGQSALSQHALNKHCKQALPIALFTHFRVLPLSSQLMLSLQPTGCWRMGRAPSRAPRGFHPLI